MTDWKRFVPNVIVSILLVFALLATEAVFFARQKALSEETYTELIASEQLTEKVSSSLQTYFETKYPTTGIPADVYMATLSDSMLETGIKDSITCALAYMDGTSDSMTFTMDFTALEESVQQFFSEYAAEIGYEKDAVYEEKVKATIETAENQILGTVDVFKFATLESAGVVTTARSYLPWLKTAQLLCTLGTFLLLGLLVWLNRKQLSHLCYWLGANLTVASVLCLIPLIYIKKTNYFAAFTIKSKQIYAAVTGLLNGLTESLLVLELVLLGIGIALLLAFVLYRRFRKQA